MIILLSLSTTKPYDSSKFVEPKVLLKFFESIKEQEKTKVRKMQNKKNLSAFIVFIFILNFCLWSSCSTKLAYNTINTNTLLYSDSCTLDKQESSGIWNYKATETQDSYSGKFVSRTGKDNPYGITYRNNFPAELKGHNIRLVLNAQIKTSDTNFCGGFVVDIINGENSIYYEFLSSKRKNSQNNIWYSVSDTLTIPMNLVQNSNYKLVIYQYNGEGKSTVDVDDVKLSFFKHENPTYLPNIPAAQTNKSNLKTLFKNAYYQIKQNTENSSIFISDMNDSLLTQQIVYHLEYKKNKASKESNTLNLTNFKCKKSNDTSIEFSASAKEISVDLILQFSATTQLNFLIKSIYSDVVIVREAVVIEMADEVSEVYRNNRKVDLNEFQNEYWLDKEGVKFGSNKRATYFYHNSAISSVQLNRVKKQLVINLDFSYDHLLLHFPLRQDTLKGIKKDISETQRTKGSSSTYHFALNIGRDCGSLPRFMKNPSGYLAAFIFTEHADYTDLRTQYAVNFGSEDIHEYRNAIGGFAKYDIPVTKSVFYNNPENINNAVFNKAFDSPICNLKGNAEFEKFIDDLYQHHFDICLHTPEQNSSNSKNLEEAIAYFAKKYDSKTWIDHGYDNGIKDNREDFVCDGLVPSSPQYTLPLWQKYNTQYFWNCYYEDSLLFNRYHFYNHFKNYYHGFGDHIPAPDYWHQNNAPTNIYSWPAHQLLFIKDLSLWQYYFNEKTFNDLIDNQEICISHVYPSRVDENTGFFKLDEDGKYVVSAEFDNALARMASYRDKNLLNLTTIRDLLDYRTSVDKVKYEILEEGKIKLSNTSNSTIHNLSMTTKSKVVKMNGKNISTKKWNDELIFWFDLGVGESVVIEYN